MQARIERRGDADAVLEGFELKHGQEADSDDPIVQDLWLYDATGHLVGCGDARVSALARITEVLPAGDRMIMVTGREATRLHKRLRHEVQAEGLCPYCTDRDPSLDDLAAVGIYILERGTFFIAGHKFGVQRLNEGPLKDSSVKATLVTREEYAARLGVVID